MSEQTVSEYMMTDYFQARQHKAANLFTTDINQPLNNVTTGDTNAENNFRKLESLMHKELRVWWDFTTLNTYMEHKMIPRGLKKNTTSVYTPEFQSRWDETLSNCSLTLMSLIISQEDLQLRELKEQILVLQVQHELKDNTSHDQWIQQYTYIQEGLRKLEHLITQTKTAKFKRD